ncbi:MAG TPA: cyclic nucleotide-binding domain-containing protein [Acidimicrobiales bacterium]|jgi:hypothetical protein|nr:cyclic nucleotide-binding domain-containing protein [Acidimicrobiales bacterium]
MADISLVPPPVDPTGLKADSYWSKMALHKVKPGYLAGAALVSYLILGISELQHVPIWLSFALALVPWGFIMLVELEWTYKHYGWLALFFLTAFVQTIHYSEHCIQVIQIHFFGDDPHKAQAIFGLFNIEWVHFLGDSFLTVATLVLLYRFPRNAWMWVATVFQLAHQAEHSFIIYNYLFQHVTPGAPGLLASPGGFIFGGVHLIRADLHWIYNTLYTVPFVLALVTQLKRSYDEALDEAFPDVPKAELVGVSRHLETFVYSPAETVLSPGEDVERLFIITEGEAGVYGHDDNGREVELATLHHGQYFGEIGLLVPGAPHRKLIRAKTRLCVLAMDEATFRHLISLSQTTQDALTAMAGSRVTIPAV